MPHTLQSSGESGGPTGPAGGDPVRPYRHPGIDPAELRLVTWQDVVGWTYLYPARWLFRVLPVRFSRAIVRWLAPLHGWLRPGTTRVVRETMNRALQGRATDGARGDPARAFMAHDLRKVVDDLLMHRLDLQQLERVVSVKGIEHLDASLADGRGVILVSGHFHANRLAKFYLRRRGYPVMSVRGGKTYSPHQGRFGYHFVAPAYHRLLADSIEDEMYARTPGLGAGLLRRLRENGIINVHIDAALSSTVVDLPMLHLVWPIPVGFLGLAEMARTPLVPMLCLGNSDGLEIRFEAPIRYPDRSSGEVTRQRLQVLVYRLQEWIVQYPDQWELWTRLDRYEKKYAEQ